MSSVTPIRRLTETYSPARNYGADGYEVYIGRLASGGFGVERRKQFVSDFKELVRLAQIGEEAVQNRGGR